MWHWSAAVHVTGLLPVHAPAWQASLWVQALPSSQACAVFVCTQPLAAEQLSAVHGLSSSQAVAAHARKRQPLTGSQLSLVHASSSAHARAWPVRHTPLPQISPRVQALPSLQGTLLAVAVQPWLRLQLSSVHGLPSSHVRTPAPWQPVAPQVSPVVHASPSSQALLLARNAQPLALSQLSVVHGLPSTHTRAAPATQPPPAQVSLVVQLLPSLHLLVLLVWMHAPLVASHVSVVQGLWSSQSLGPSGWHRPSWQLSPMVQPFSSSQGKSLALKLQPFKGSQLSVVQGVSSWHVALGPAVHAPSLQLSPTVQTFPSSHAVDPAMNAQPVAVRQVSSVQSLPSAQTVGVPGRHRPTAHTSPVVHALPSSHAVAASLVVQPTAGLQASIVHGLPSSQGTVAPGTHAPPLHESPAVHALPSLHGVAVAAFCSAHWPSAPQTAIWQGPAAGQSAAAAQPATAASTAKSDPVSLAASASSPSATAAASSAASSALPVSVSAAVAVTSATASAASGSSAASVPACASAASAMVAASAPASLPASAASMAVATSVCAAPTSSGASAPLSASAASMAAATSVCAAPTSSVASAPLSASAASMAAATSVCVAPTSPVASAPLVVPHAARASSNTGQNHARGAAASRLDGQKASMMSLSIAHESAACAPESVMIKPPQKGCEAKPTTAAVYQRGAKVPCGRRATTLWAG